MISIMYFRLLVGYGYYRDNIVYRDNLKNTMKTYRDIAFSIIAQPYSNLVKVLKRFTNNSYKMIGFLSSDSGMVMEL